MRKAHKDNLFLKRKPENLGSSQKDGGWVGVIAGAVGGILKNLKR